MAIHEWPEDERPRERLIKDGASTLSTAELLAIFLRTGVAGKSAVDLARELLNKFGGLRELLEIDLHRFCAVPGVGNAKYVQLKAVSELSRRYWLEGLENLALSKDFTAVKKYLIAELGTRKQEVFGCLLLDSQCRFIKFLEIFQGTLNKAEIYFREILQAVLDNRAAFIIMAHNHPSGDPTPSVADRTVTQALQKALEIINVEILDHIVIGHNQALSFSELGYIDPG